MKKENQRDAVKMDTWFLILLLLSIFFDIFYWHKSYRNGLRDGQRIIQLSGPDLCACSEQSETWRLDEVPRIQR